MLVHINKAELLTAVFVSSYSQIMHFCTVTSLPDVFMQELQDRESHK